MTRGLLALIQVLLLTLILSWQSAHAYDQKWLESAIKISFDSKLQRDIDAAFLQMFKSPAQAPLCGVTLNIFSLVYSLGISPNTAVEISKICNYENENMNRLAKIMSKAYYISPVIDPNLESWTDYGNRTFLFIDQNYNTERLTRALIHETAITFDAKMRVLYTGYLAYQRNKHFKRVGNFDIISLDNMSDDEQTIQKAFNIASTSTIATTFAALRAFQFEQVVTNERLALDHKTCVEKFRSTYKKIKSFSGYNFSVAADQIPSMIAEAVDKNWAPSNEDEERKIFEFILSENLKLEDQGRSVTFCNYMSFPLLTGKTTWTFFASGPRPRLTGGAGGQGSGGASGGGEKLTRDESQSFLGKLFNSKPNPNPYKIGNKSADSEFQQNLQEALKVDLNQLPSLETEQ